MGEGETNNNFPWALLKEPFALSWGEDRNVNSTSKVKRRSSLVQENWKGLDREVACELHLE